MQIRVACLLFCPLVVWASSNATTVKFSTTDSSVGPFPTNGLTVSTSTQKTGLQINLPVPSVCATAPTSNGCVNILLLNQLDGFSVNPRITICFSGAINPNTLTSGVSFVPVGAFGLPIAINQVLYDPTGHCAYAKPDQVLDQQTTYLLSVTSAVLDANNRPVQPDPGFSACAAGGRGTSSYCQSLSQALGWNFGSVVSASLFTTLSATNWLQQARAQINSPVVPEGLAPAGYPAGSPSTFNLASVQSITWMPTMSALTPQTLPLNVLSGVESIYFGLFQSPLYLNTSGPLAGTISVTPTNQPIAKPALVEPVSFHVFLPPAKSAPSNGFPVIIYGHGLGDTQFGAPTYVAGAWAQKGFATLAMEINGHGYGSGSTTVVQTGSAQHSVSNTVLTPGRGILLPGSTAIGPTDGCILPGALATRDCGRQTAADLIALVRTIQANASTLHLDPSRIYYVGQSFGSIYGTLFETVEPNVSAVALNVGGGTQTDVARLSPIARQLGALYLLGFAPPLINVTGLPGGAPPEAPFYDLFNDEYVYRGQVVTDNVPGALAIQAAFEQSDWLGMLGDPLSYAAHLQREPLPGMSWTPTLVQFGLGDLEVPNPTESALVRAGGLQFSTWMLETNVAATVQPGITTLAESDFPYYIYPHRFLSNPTLFTSSTPAYALETNIALAAQQQIADFFTFGGFFVPDPNFYLTGGLAFHFPQLFQIPFTLPDMLNFQQTAPFMPH